MRYAYGEYDGQEFPTPDSLFDYNQIMDFVLAYGDKALDALAKLNPEDAQMLEKLMQEGMLEKVAGKFRLTPRAINAMQHKALMEIFANLPRGSAGRASNDARPGRGQTGWMAPKNISLATRSASWISIRLCAMRWSGKARIMGN